MRERRLTTAARAGRETSFDDHYMRIVIAFDTGAERYRWLNQGIFIARGRLLSSSELFYEIHRVT